MSVIFHYANKPTNNFLGTDGSSDAITLFDTGIIRYEHYLFGFDTPSKTKEFGPFPEVVTKVEELLALYAVEIEGFPDFIDNDCCDGSWQHFQLGEKKITVDNMCYCSEEDIRTIRLFHEGDQLEKILVSVQLTNKMVEIYHKITTVIKDCCDPARYRQ